MFNLRKKLLDKLADDKYVEDRYLKTVPNLAYFDTMTGVHNRTYYDMEVRSKYCQIECYVSYIDVDNLKYTNDIFGHAAGDELIRGVVEQLNKIKGIMEICRVGGDEFIMITSSYVEADLIGASIGTYHKRKYEDISSGVEKADCSCQRNKQVGRHHAEK